MTEGGMKRGNKWGAGRGEACWEQRRREEIERERQRERARGREKDGFKAKGMAYCDKHWLKSLSRSDTTGTVECVSLLTLWISTRISQKHRNKKPQSLNVSLNERNDRLVSGIQKHIVFLYFNTCTLARQSETVYFVPSFLFSSLFQSSVLSLTLHLLSFIRFLSSTWNDDRDHTKNSRLYTNTSCWI